MPVCFVNVCLLLLLLFVLLLAGLSERIKMYVYAGEMSASPKLTFYSELQLGSRPSSSSSSSSQYWWLIVQRS